MGFSLSWVAFKGLSKAEILHRTGFRETGQTVEYMPDESAPFAFSTFPTGWLAVFSSDVRYAAPEGLGHLSDGATVLGCQIEEHSMVSAVALFTNGREVWRVAHDSQQGRYDLDVSGTPPPELEPVRKRLIEKQDAAGGKTSDTDFIWDVPVTLAQALTGYRHDEVRAAWGVPQYEKLVVVH